MDRLAAFVGRRYRLFDYAGAPDAERVMVLMGSGAEAAHEPAERLVADGDKVGVLAVRLYRRSQWSTSWPPCPRRIGATPPPSSAPIT